MNRKHDDDQIQFSIGVEQLRAKLSANRMVLIKLPADCKDHEIWAVLPDAISDRYLTRLPESLSEPEHIILIRHEMTVYWVQQEQVSREAWMRSSLSERRTSIHSLWEIESSTSREIMLDILETVNCFSS